jgi:hypothetical protein
MREVIIKDCSRCPFFIDVDFIDVTLEYNYCTQYDVELSRNVKEIDKPIQCDIKSVIINKRSD